MCLAHWEMLPATLQQLLLAAPPRSHLWLGLAKRAVALLVQARPVLSGQREVGKVVLLAAHRAVAP